MMVITLFSPETVKVGRPGGCMIIRSWRKSNFQTHTDIFRDLLLVCESHHLISYLLTDIIQMFHVDAMHPIAHKVPTTVNQHTQVKALHAVVILARHQEEDSLEHTTGRASNHSSPNSAPKCENCVSRSQYVAVDSPTPVPRAQNRPLPRILEG
ncbi:hypothetical protein RvY_06879 [Ramazzottius varieornatus]|uniref:Uncharacterized protein n=1 Tax=Ramazzottius varieornatus TaxID=947166 RepID=A0A1D1V051_RAMVA|nr:hypothetical protein RvY_06879 [Ramazzottius varieornatus]